MSDEIPDTPGDVSIVEYMNAAVASIHDAEAFVNDIKFPESLREEAVTSVRANAQIMATLAVAAGLRDLVAVLSPALGRTVIDRCRECGGFAWEVIHAGPNSLGKRAPGAHPFR